jgi:hypothetical protein
LEWGFYFLLIGKRQKAKVEGKEIKDERGKMKEKKKDELEIIAP